MSNQQPITVMIVDDHLMVRDGLKVFLSVFDDIRVVAEAEDGEQAVARCAQAQPDVVLMDLVMPTMDGPTAITQILAQFPQTKIIALTSFIEEDLIQRSLAAGAVGYLLKDVHSDQLAMAIRAAYQGRSMIDPAVTQVLIHASHRTPPPGNDLTKRELDVLALLVDGKTNKEIGQTLSISVGTVRLHVSNILAKLGVSNRTEAATLAVQHKLIP